MPLKKNATPVKPPEGSTMIHEEIEDMSFRVSQLEQKFKGVVKTLDLCNMEKKWEESMETNMGNMEKKMEKLEERMERIVNLIQHPKGNVS